MVNGTDKESCDRGSGKLALVEALCLDVIRSCQQIRRYTSLQATDQADPHKQSKEHVLAVH